MVKPAAFPARKRCMGLISRLLDKKFAGFNRDPELKKLSIDQLSNQDVEDWSEGFQ